MNILATAKDRLLNETCAEYDAHWERAQALDEKYSCEHEHKELRKRVYPSGAIHYVMQCQRCGARASNALRKAKGVEPPAFDLELERRWKEAWEAERSAIWDAYKRDETSRHAAYRDKYHDYLASPEWKARRAKVLERCKGICEGCAEQPASDVHHLTYMHVGEEFLYELVALCRECHGRAHETI